MASNEQTVRLQVYNPLKQEKQSKATHSQHKGATAHKQQDFRALRIVLIVFSALIVAFSIATIVMDGIILGNTYKYSGLEREAQEKAESGGDQSMEGTGLTQFFISMLFGISVAFGAYNVITFAVCMVIGIATPQRLLAPSYSAAACLLVTLMFGLLMSAYTAVLYLVKQTDVFQPPGAVPVIRTIFILVYFIMQLIATCCFTCPTTAKEY